MQNLQDLALQVAISEVLNPTLGVTQQVLAVHQLVVQDGSPLILLVDQTTELGAYYVYFAIQKQPYYFVVVIREEQEKLTASASYIEAGVRVYLTIISKTLDPDIITEKLKIKPTRKHLLGEAKYPKAPHVKFEENFWDFEPQRTVPGSLENKLNFLLDQLEPARPRISELQDQCETYICICYEGYQAWMGGWHLDQATIQRIAALGAEVDFDLYASGKWDLPS